MKKKLSKNNKRTYLQLLKWCNKISKITNELEGKEGRQHATISSKFSKNNKQNNHQQLLKLGSKIKIANEAKITNGKEIQIICISLAFIVVSWGPSLR